MWSGCPLDLFIYKTKKINGSPVRIRTSIDGVRVRSLTVRRPGNVCGALGVRVAAVNRLSRNHFRLIATSLNN